MMLVKTDQDSIFTSLVIFLLEGDVEMCPQRSQNLIHDLCHKVDFADIKYDRRSMNEPSNRSFTP